jgi:hypothetical protein
VSSPYDFTVDWFSHNVPRWTEQLGAFAGRPDLRFLEIGSFEGRSAVWLLEHVLTHETARLLDPGSELYLDRATAGITAPLDEIDWTDAFWRGA